MADPKHLHLKLRWNGNSIIFRIIWHTSKCNNRLSKKLIYFHFMQTLTFSKHLVDLLNKQQWKLFFFCFVFLNVMIFIIMEHVIFNIIFVSPHEWMTSFYWILFCLHHRVIKFVWFKHRLFFLSPLYVQIQPLSYLSQWKTLLLITEHCINTNVRTHAQTHRRSNSLPFSV